MVIFPKLIYRFNIIPIKNPAWLLYRNRQTQNPKFDMQMQGTQTIRSRRVSKKNKVGRLILYDFKTGKGIKTAWPWCESSCVTKGVGLRIQKLIFTFIVNKVSTNFNHCISSTSK